MLSALLSFALAGSAFAAPLTDMSTRDLFKDLAVASDDHYAKAIATRDLKLRQHRENMENYERHLLDDVQVADHAEILLSATAMEESSLKKRAPEDEVLHKEGLTNWFSGNVDILYSTIVGFGTGAGQAILDIVPDTGSADLWAPSSASNMVGTNSTWNYTHITFPASDSPTLQKSGNLFNATYGLGHAMGEIVTDTISFANFTVTNQAFGLVDKVDDQFIKQPNDGIMGLCSSKISKTKSTTFFEKLIAAKALVEPYFSVYLTRGRDYQPGVKGAIPGGGICLGCLLQPLSGSVSDTITWANVTTFAYWQILQDSISLNGQPIPGTSLQAVMDTGTTMIYLPETVASKMLAPLGGKKDTNGLYIVPVSSLTDNTVYSFSYAGQSFDIYLMDLIMGFTDSSKNAVYMNIMINDMTGPNGEEFALVGDAFLKNVISIYSYSHNGYPAVGLQQITRPKTTNGTPPQGDNGRK